MRESLAFVSCITSRYILAAALYRAWSSCVCRFISASACFFCVGVALRHRQPWPMRESFGLSARQFLVPDMCIPFQGGQNTHGAQIVVALLWARSSPVHPSSGIHRPNVNARGKMQGACRWRRDTHHFPPHESRGNRDRRRQSRTEGMDENIHAATNQRQCRGPIRCGKPVHTSGGSSWIFGTLVSFFPS